MSAGLSRLAADLRNGELHRPGDEGYLRATTPRNRSGRQSPAAAVLVRDAEDVASCVRFAAAAELRVAVQCTGHGAAGVIGSDTLLLDTSEMTQLEIDSDRRIARVGAGVRSAQLAAAAEEIGMLAAVGTAPDVGAVGYTLHGGVGWLTRAFGMASASLRRVEFVDGRGDLRRADESHDTEALWAFRGGGGVGVAVSIEIALHPCGGLWGGYALWPHTEAATVTAAWSKLVSGGPTELSTVVSMLRTPTAPAELGGASAVYLGAASPHAATAGPALAGMLAEVPAPLTASFGVCDTARLAAIHLDPPVAVPAIGDGRWLHGRAGLHAHEIITAAHTQGEPALAEVELRHVADSDRGVDGALTSPPGDFLLHAVGLAESLPDRNVIEHELALVREMAGPDDTGRSSAPFRDGQTSALDAFPPAQRRRLARVAAELDPDGRFAVPRPLSLTTGPAVSSARRR